LADDPAIWLNTAEPARSVVIGSKKAASGGGLGVYDLAGDQIQFLTAGELNNLDIRSNVFGGKVFLTATNRTNASLQFFLLDPATRTLTTAGSTAVGFEPYGGCLYISPTDGQVYAFVTNRNSPYDFDQYRLNASGSTVSGTKVRDMKTSTLSEGCVACDPVGASVFLSEEDKGVYQYNAEPTGGSSRNTVATVGTNGLTADAEGLAIARDRTTGRPRVPGRVQPGEQQLQGVRLRGPVHVSEDLQRHSQRLRGRRHRHRRSGCDPRQPGAAVSERPVGRA
jgi:3-phytase